ncbi:MAG: LptF/LptG family permease [Chthonomonas sp.]|nr:LptF/LptG family permease [Chthonomonas sp.]
MKRLDRLIIAEMMGPFIFGVGIFTVLLMAATFLLQFTNYVASGISIWTVMTMVFLVLPGMLVQTFPMAMLLSALLGFGKMSGESEITAVRAAGASLGRVMIPVAGFGIGVALISFLFGQYVVPEAAIRAAVIKDQILRQLEGSSARPASYAVTERVKIDGKERNRITSFVTAVDFDIGSRLLRKAQVIGYDKLQSPAFFLMADELEYQDNKEWRIRGAARVLSSDGKYLAEIADGAWPNQVAKPTFSPQDIIAQNTRDMTSLSMAQIAKAISDAEANPSVLPKQVYNLQKGYWDKIAIPLAAVVYALMGAPLGIRNQRSGGATGFLFAVIIIFAYFMLSNVLFITGQGGAFPAWFASFFPVVLGVIGAMAAIHYKNR